MAYSKGTCPICKKDLVKQKDDLGSYLHCLTCEKNWCPNVYLVWHDNDELKSTKDSRGDYHHCSICHWYSGIDRESQQSAVTQEALIGAIKNLLRDSLDVNKITFKSTLAGEEPWFSLEERLGKYGKIRTTDLEMLFDTKSVTKFEIKGWKNYDIQAFYGTGRAHVNKHEVKDAVKLDGYVCFITLQDGKIICVKANDIIGEWDKRKVAISMSMTDEQKITRAIFSEFGKGALVVTAPDKQQNVRFIMSKKFKEVYCKELSEFKDEILLKIKSIV